MSVGGREEKAIDVASHKLQPFTLYPGRDRRLCSAEAGVPTIVRRCNRRWRNARPIGTCYLIKYNDSKANTGELNLT